jgi:hypothetical protein
VLKLHPHRPVKFMGQNDPIQPIRNGHGGLCRQPIAPPDSVVNRLRVRVLKLHPHRPVKFMGQNDPIQPIRNGHGGLCRQPIAPPDSVVSRAGL